MIVGAHPEDEIQALVALAELTDPVETPNNNLRGAFERESNMFIWENQMAESTASTAPYDPATCSERRTLYHVRKAETASADERLDRPVRE